MLGFGLFSRSSVCSPRKRQTQLRSDLNVVQHHVQSLASRFDHRSPLQLSVRRENSEIEGRRQFVTVGVQRRTSPAQYLAFLLQQFVDRHRNPERRTPPAKLVAHVEDDPPFLDRQTDFVALDLLRLVIPVQ